MARQVRADHEGPHRQTFEKNKKKILAAQSVCGICGKEVDKKLRYPHPLSPVIDHIIPVIKGGHPSDLDNLQLAHMCCNRQKADKLVERKAVAQEDQLISNRVLPHSVDWMHFYDR